MKRSILFLVVIVATSLIAGELNDYLILSNIGDYVFMDRIAHEYSGNSGVLIGAGHFDLDHTDMSHETRYVHPVTILGVQVQITQHADSPSDQWLLHEVERGFRERDTLEGTVQDQAMVREIDGNKVFFYGGGIVGYRWLSSNVVVSISYNNMSGPKPEPLEVVQAYLAKHPSTITLTDAEVKSTEHTKQWLRDEMERRLWLCEKWLPYAKDGEGDLKSEFRNIYDNLDTFIKYRGKYMGEVAENDEKLAIINAFTSLDPNNVEQKVQEYREWWNEHKDDDITL